MKIVKEFQPFLNKTLNQPRTCLWLTPEDIDEYKLLQTLDNSIKNTEKIISGFTGTDRNTLLIQFPKHENIQEEDKCKRMTRPVL